MKVKELIEVLKSMPQDKNIVLGVQGFLTERKTEIRIKDTKKGVLLSDECYYDFLEVYRNEIYI